jgi:hypothetical protein
LAWTISILVITNIKLESRHATARARVVEQRVALAAVGGAV